jgi:quercetin dioxygenase-like cupin family protein
MNFTRNADTSALQIESIEGKAMVGALLIKPLIQGEQMSLMETQVAAGVAAPPHTHDHESLIYVVRGLLKTVVGDNSFVLGPGDVCRHEPLRVDRRLFRLSHAAMAGSFSMA